MEKSSISYGNFCSRRLDCHFLKNSIFHRLGCRLMKIFVPWTWLLSLEIFRLHRLGCCLMKYFNFIDLVVIL